MASSAEKILGEFEKTKLNLMNDEVKQRETLSALYEINKKTKKIVGEKSDLEQQKMLIDANVKELAGKIMVLAEQAKKQKAALRQRLSTIYKLGGQGIARMLLSSSSSGQLERNLKILGIVAKNDLELIKNYSKSLKELEFKKKKLQIRWAHLKKLENKISITEKQLASENVSRNKFLAKIRRSQEKNRLKISEIRKSSQQIAAFDESGLLDALYAPSFSEQKGHLPKPIDGKVVQGYGLIKDEVHNTVIGHKGQFYSSKVGAAVKAVFSGRVAFASEVPGFGKTIILDHGDHYYSVYSHSSEIKVKPGEEVKQLQTLATSGRSGTDFGDGIYFEIRHFSEPADPKFWMKGSLQ